MARTQTVSITTNASGVATEYSTTVNGRILNIVYGGQFDAAMDLTLTTEDTGQEVLSFTNVPKAAASFAPRQVVNLASSGAAVAAWVPIHAAFERLKFVLAGGGNAVTGTFTIVVDE
jgi:hypothetical protein